jgi:hypothetical protein
MLLEGKRHIAKEMGCQIGAVEAQVCGVFQIREGEIKAKG